MSNAPQHPHVRTPQQPSGMPIHRYAPFTPDRAARPHLAAEGHHHRPPLVRRRPPRRQPGPDRPDDARPQAAHVRAAGPHGLQGDRGRLPRRQPDRLRLHPPAHRGRPGPRRRHRPGPHPGPGRADRAHLRVPARRQAGDRAPLQLDVHPPASGRLQLRPRRHRRHRRPRGPAGPQARRADGRHRDPVRVLPRVLHRHRARLRRRGLQRGHRRVGADRRPADDHQPAGDRRDGRAHRLRRPDRVDAPQPGPAATPSS